MIIKASPFSTQLKKEYVDFLNNNNLSVDINIDYSVIILDDYNSIIATGSLDECIIKNVAVHQNYRGNDLSSKIITLLVNHAYENSIYHLFIYTKPSNKELFKSLGFFTIAENSQVLFMENRKNGLVKYLQQFKNNSNNNGIIIMNCNPMTIGHEYLITRAANLCDHLYIMIVSNEKSEFTTTERLSLVKKCCSKIPNITIFTTNYYQISRATFPDYFLDDKKFKSDIQADIDLKIFIEYIIPTLNIKYRFLGSEPEDKTTNSYNRLIKNSLNSLIQVIELPRLMLNEYIVSASKVREKIKNSTSPEYLNMIPFSIRDDLKKYIDSKVLLKEGEIK